MRQDDHCCGDLLSKLVQLFVSFFDLLVKSLVFYLQLLEVDQVQAISELFLLLQNLLLVGKSISECDVLQSILMHLLVLKSIHFLPFVKHFL